MKKVKYRTRKFGRNIKRLKQLMIENPNAGSRALAGMMAAEGLTMKLGKLVNTGHVKYLRSQMGKRPHKKKPKQTQNQVFNLSAEQMDLPLAQATKTDEELIAFIQIAMTLHMPAQRRIEIIRAALG